MKTIRLEDLGLQDDSPYIHGDEAVLGEWYKVMQAIDSTRRCVVITGAGISVSSGVPDFRSPDGLFQKLKQKHPKELSNGKDLFDAHLFKSATMTELFYSFMGELRHIVNNASCTPSHDFIKELDKRGKLLRCYTQNIDSLEKRVGLETSLYPPEDANNNGKDNTNSTSSATNVEYPITKQVNDTVPCKDEIDSQLSTGTNESVAERVSKPQARNKRTVATDKTFAKAIQLHGTIENVVCTVCNKKYQFCEKVALEFKTGSPPACPNCQEIDLVREISGKRQIRGGVLRPDVVLYNEMHPQGDRIGMLCEYDLNRKPDCLIVIGTSLKIPGVKRLIREMTKAVHASSEATKRKGGGLSIFVNTDPPAPAGEWKRTFDYHIQGLSDEMVNLLKYQISPELVQKFKPKRRKQCTLSSSFNKSGINSESSSLEDSSNNTTDSKSQDQSSNGSKESIKEPIRGSPKRKRQASKSNTNKSSNKAKPKPADLKNTFKSTKNPNTESSSKSKASNKPCNNNNTAASNRSQVAIPTKFEP